MTGRHHVLLYEYVPDVVERRAPFRDAHLELVRGWSADRRLLMGGAVGDPPHGAMLVFAAPPEEIEAFVAADPYVGEGIVTGWRIEPWAVVVSAFD
jgi:hypothetical protein